MDSYLESLQQAIAGATSDMSSEQLTRKLEGKWSAAEVLEHLYLTYTGTQKAFERCLKAGKPLAGIPTFKQRVSATALVTEFGYFPSGRKSPDMVLPKGMPRKKSLPTSVPRSPPWTRRSRNAKSAMARASSSWTIPSSDL